MEKSVGKRADRAAIRLKRACHQILPITHFALKVLQFGDCCFAQQKNDNRAENIQNDSQNLTPNFKVDLGVRLGVRFTSA